MTAARLTPYPPAPCPDTLTRFGDRALRDNPKHTERCTS